MVGPAPGWPNFFDYAFLSGHAGALKFFTSGRLHSSKRSLRSFVTSVWGILLLYDLRYLCKV